MSFDRNRLPGAETYFDGQGLHLAGRGKWRTTRCTFHGGSDSMRINTGTGAFVCMNCGAKGGDVLAYHMADHGMDFITAAKELGAWHDDGKPVKPHRPKPLPANAAIQVLAFEATLVALSAANVANGVTLTDLDRSRVLAAAGRISRIVEAYQ